MPNLAPPDIGKGKIKGPGVRFSVRGLSNAAAVANNPTFRNFTRTPITNPLSLVKQDINRAAHVPSPSEKPLRSNSTIIIDPDAITKQNLSITTVLPKGATHSIGTRNGGFHIPPEEKPIAHRKGGYKGRNKNTARGRTRAHGKRPASSRQLFTSDSSKFCPRDLTEVWKATDFAMSALNKEDELFLASLLNENSSGCLRFLRECFELSDGDNGPFLTPKPYRRLGAEILRSSICLAPHTVTSAYHSDHGMNRSTIDLHHVIADSGGRDDRLWDRIQELGNSARSSGLIGTESNRLHSCSNGSMGVSLESTDSLLQHDPAAMNHLVLTTPGNDMVHSSSSSTDLENLKGQANEIMTIPESKTGDRAPDVHATRRKKAILVAEAAEKDKDKEPKEPTGREAATQIISLTQTGFEISARQDVLAHWGSLIRHFESRGLPIEQLMNSERFLDPLPANPPHSLGDDDNRCSSTGTLGKRGRSYIEVWEEELFLNRTNQESRFSVCESWGDVITDYSDNHDGAYREHMMLALRPSWTWDKPKREKRANNAGASTDELSSDMGLDVLVPPPPVSYHHPAAWGRHSRDLSKVEAALVRAHLSMSSIYSYVHPAAFSSSPAIKPSAPAASDIEDADELNIFCERARRLVDSIDAQNFVALERLTTRARRSAALMSMQVKRESYETVITKYYNKTSEGDGMPIRPFIPAADEDLDEEDAGASGSKYGTRGSMGFNASIGKRQHVLGSLLRNHVPHGDFVHALKIGELVEARGPNDNKWYLGYVIHFFVDDAILVRAIKVGFMNSPPGIGHAVWYFVEDACIAPPGTHYAPERVLKIKAKYQKNRADVRLLDSGVSASSAVSTNQGVNINGSVIITIDLSDDDQAEGQSADEDSGGNADGGDFKQDSIHSTGKAQRRKSTGEGHDDNTSNNSKRQRMSPVNDDEMVYDVPSGDEADLDHEGSEVPMV